MSTVIRLVCGDRSVGERPEEHARNTCRSVLYQWADIGSESIVSLGAQVLVQYLGFTPFEHLHCCAHTHQVVGCLLHDRDVIL